MKIPSAKSFSLHADTLLADGFCVLPKVLSARDCKDFIGQYDKEQQFRSTIDMARYNFGSGQYRYFDSPLPDKIARLRAGFYELLAEPAREWAERAKIEEHFPDTFEEYEGEQERLNQTRPTPLILRYRSGDYNCLHQDISGEHYFPWQIIFSLSESGKDFEGGELVLTQQRPRMQTIPHLVPLDRGDCVILASKHHPVEGKRGYYRTEFRHGVSRVTSGERYTLGIILHNYAAKS